MATISAVRSSPVVPIPQPQLNSQDTRVTQASRSIFQFLKDSLFSLWGCIEFTFFCVLGWVQPFFGPRIEVLFLRIGNVFRSIRDGWRRQAMEQEITQLRTEVARLSPLPDLNRQLQLQINDLNTQKTDLLQNIQNIQHQREHHKEQATLLTTHTTDQNGEINLLRSQNAALSINQATLEQTLLKTQTHCTTLQSRIATMEQAHAALQTQLQEPNASSKHLETIATYLEALKSPSKLTNSDASSLTALHTAITLEMQTYHDQLKTQQSQTSCPIESTRIGGLLSASHRTLTLLQIIPLLQTQVGG